MAVERFRTCVLTWGVYSGVRPLSLKLAARGVYYDRGVYSHQHDMLLLTKGL